MSRRSRLVLLSVLVVAVSVGRAAEPQPRSVADVPSVVYVPYEDLRTALEAHRQGVFLPYDEFERLWKAAQGDPARLEDAPTPYLVSTARLSGRVAGDLVSLQLELTVDVLSDQWVQVPLGLSGSAVTEATVIDPAGKAPALVRVEGGNYLLVTRGRGRRTLQVELVRQLTTRPGLNVLNLNVPAAAITTLDLLIPEENMKVEVKPLLAATTSQAAEDGRPATRLQAFLGSVGNVELSWKPKAQADQSLEPVVIADQYQHISVDEALIRQDVSLRYDVRRRGVSRLVVQLPGDFRLISVDGANISKWDVEAPPDGSAAAPQILTVELFSPVIGDYALALKMERFLKESAALLPLTPVITQQALRQTGLLAVSHSPRRSVELRDAKDLARVDVGRLPEGAGALPGVLAYRFISPDYAATLAIGTVEPRVKVDQSWRLGVTATAQELGGELVYQVDRAGLFELRVALAEPWQVVSVGPAELVDEYEFEGGGPDRVLKILLRKETLGSIRVNLLARAPRGRIDDPVSFTLPVAREPNLQLIRGRLVLLLPPQLRAEVDKLHQLQPAPLGDVPQQADMAPAMAFEYKTIDLSVPAGVDFRIVPKPSQVSAVVHHLVDIQPGSVVQQALVRYHVMYAPVDTFYLRVPADLADGLHIEGANIKEKPRLDAPPPDSGDDDASAAAPAAPDASAGAQPAPVAPDAAPATQPAWAYYKIVLQSPVLGEYSLKVSHRRSFTPGAVGEAVSVDVATILAAGKLSGQSGTIAVATTQTLAVGAPTQREHLEDADPSSPADLPHEPFRRNAVLAFRYTAPPFSLSLPVVTQKEAAVFTTIATNALIEQVLGRDGTLNGRACYSILTSRGERLAIRLPPDARLYAVSVNGVEAPVEASAEANTRIVRLPPSAGQTSLFVLEVSYGQEHADPGRLGAPSLREDTPVQQTLWRVWLPSDQLLLGHDRDFAPVNAQVMLKGPGPQLNFTFPAQGRRHDFVRQGPPGELGLLTARKEVFTVLVWAVVLAGGAAMLWLGAWPRLLVLLGVAVAAAVVNLVAPLLVEQLLLRAWMAGLIVLVLWAGHAVLRKRRRTWKPAIPPPAPPAATAPAGADKE